MFLFFRIFSFCFLFYSWCLTLLPLQILFLLLCVSCFCDPPQCVSHVSNYSHLPCVYIPCAPCLLCQFRFGLCCKCSSIFQVIFISAFLLTLPLSDPFGTFGTLTHLLYTELFLGNCCPYLV